MLSDRTREELTRQVSEYFGTEDSRLTKAALQLQDSGWVWDQMRPLLVNVFNAGYNVGWDDSESES